MYRGVENFIDEKNQKWSGCCAPHHCSERTSFVPSGTVDHNGHLHVARLEVPLAVAQVDDSSPVVHGCPLRVPRGIRRCPDHCTGTRDRLRCLLARHEREFPRGGRPEVGEYVRTGGHDRDRDKQLLQDRAVRQGTKQGGCRWTGHEDRAQDRVCHRTGGLSVGLSWGVVAG